MIVLVPILDVTPVCHTSTTRVGFVTIALSNGPIVPCTTPPLVLKLQRNLMSYANQPKKNPVKTTNHLVVPPHHHVVSANTITPHTTLKNLVVPNVVDCVAALTAAPLVDHPAVIVHTMIELVDHLVLVMTTTLVTMTSLMIHQPSYMIAP